MFEETAAEEMNYTSQAQGAIATARIRTIGGIRIRLAESFELRADGELVAIPGSAQRLLAFLALRGRPLRRSYVSGTLWPDELEERAGARLRGSLSRLRQAVGDDAVLIMGDRLQLSPSVVVDVHEIESSFDRLAEPGLSPHDFELWFDALNSELLTDWYDEWVVGEREQYRQLRLHALEALCMGLTACGRFPLAVRAGLAAVAADPLRESAQRVLIQTYLEEGNPSDAVHQYRRYRQALMEELDLTPTPRLEELVRPFLPGLRG